MTDSNDVQALESISNAVDDSQLKIILTTQCIKAQSLLVAKLRKQSEHQKEICNFINGGNVKLKAEIRIAEQKITSTNVALGTIKSANVELQKELLLTKERRSDVVQRVDNGIIKYEKLWLDAKTKYENIPFIKHYIQTKNQYQAVKQNINVLINDFQKLTNDISDKKKKLADLDRTRIIELANYLVIERPGTLNLIQQKCDKINNIKKQIGNINKNSNDSVLCNIKISKVVKKPIEKEDKNNNSEMDLNKSGDDTGMVLPKLELCYIDLDLISTKLEKIKKSDSFMTPSTRVQNPIEFQQNAKSNDNNDFEMIFIGDNPSTHKNYSNKKLINILDDVKINDSEAKDILSKVKQSDLRDVSVSEVIVANIDVDGVIAKTDEEVAAPMKIEEDLTPKTTMIIGPPSQFLDLSQISSQKSDIVMVEDNPTTQTNLVEINDPDKTDEGNTLDDSKDADNREADASFEKIKDSIMKKHKLDLSPQFVYSKKPMTTTKSEDVVTSKFFNGKNIKNENAVPSGNTCNVDICQEPLRVEDVGKDKELDDTAQLSEKMKDSNLELQKDVPISGFLFSHGADGIIQLSNTSVDTTGYGDGENDFPSCIDSSLLLSPKADLDVQDAGPNDGPILSQEVPNFLSGLRKTGCSFFGANTADEASTSDTNTKPLQSHFNFNFGGEQKKTRGGLFSMFR